MKLMIFMALATLMSSLLILMGYMMPNHTLELQKKSPYECGFDPMKSARLPFSFRFFLVAILFLIFDLEMVLLFPLLPALNNDIANLLTLSFLFFVILASGLAYEWSQGGLEWAQ